VSGRADRRVWRRPASAVWRRGGDSAPPEGVVPGPEGRGRRDGGRAGGAGRGPGRGPREPPAPRRSFARHHPGEWYARSGSGLLRGITPGSGMRGGMGERGLQRGARPSCTLAGHGPTLERHYGAGRTLAYHSPEECGERSGRSDRRPGQRRRGWRTGAREAAGRRSAPVGAASRGRGRAWPASRRRPTRPPPAAAGGRAGGAHRPAGPPRRRSRRRRSRPRRRPRARPPR
jgi:hypothetical protein